MITKRAPQAASSLASWLSYLENLYSKAIDLGLERVNQVAARLGILKSTPFVFTVTGTNDKGITCRTLELILMTARYEVSVYSSPHLVRYTEHVRVQGQELPESVHTASFAEIESTRGDTSLTYFGYDTLSVLWLLKQAQLGVMILGVGLGGCLDTTNIVDADVAVVTSIALDHTDRLRPDHEGTGREKAGISYSEEPAIVGEPEMPSTTADVTQEGGAPLQCRSVGWNYSVTDHDWTSSDVYGTLESLLLSLVPQPNVATALVVLRASGLEASGNAIRDGIANAILSGRFQTAGEPPRAIFDVVYNPHAAEYLAGRMKALPKNGHMLAVIGILHDKDIAGTLARLKSVADGWYCAPLEGLRGTTAEQLSEHLGNGKSFDNAARVWDAAMADVKAEDTVLVCGSSHMVTHIMEVIDVRRSDGK